ncbi:energy-coupling factor ABC transporter ATP-binding protein [Ancylothrix sp. C2]|uniref:energy-coupling factor ABC transporter ATP-binding protein n=1 Tax=Ancylothrix sp. D3o TaxID=2953691 RepID=UPI0021BAD35A|nr:ABC transporter ATP-binding protein [Ancylothrix sp. D3o]MCT7949482.1 energy-coupling factor ABC transporter ATP-binding protein [Ancylothrix sp. D3o]
MSSSIFGQSKPAIQVENLVFSYPNQKPTLQGISLNIQPGERLALLGPTGSGKSTLLDNLVGLKQPSSGQIFIQGTRLETSNLAQIRRQIGFCFQDADDQLFMPTILEDITFGPRNYGVPPAIAKDKARQLLAEFGLEAYENRSAHELSGGQKRLAALAAILALEPSILILDEPTNGLDPGWRRHLAKVLINATVDVLLIASHDLNWIRKTTQRAIVLTDGKIQADAPANELLENAELLESFGLPVDY